MIANVLNGHGAKKEKKKCGNLKKNVTARDGVQKTEAIMNPTIIESSK